MNSFTPYLEQLQRRADELGVSLDDICAKEGVSHVTLWRWRTGKTFCSERVAQRLFERMAEIAEKDTFHTEKVTLDDLNRENTDE